MNTAEAKASVLKEVITNLNKALDIIAESSDTLHEAIVDKELDSSEEWRALDIEAFCLALMKSIKEKATEHGYYYW